MTRKPSDSAFLAEQVNQVYGNEPVGMAATVINATILTYVQWNVVSRPTIIGWLIAIFGVTAFRSWINFRFRRASVKPQDAVRWGRIFRAELLLAGLTWGAVGIPFFVGGDGEHQVFTAFVLGGMVAGAAALYSSLKSAFIFFALPVLIPIFLSSALQGGTIHHSMAMMMLVFGISMWFTSKHLQSTTWTSIRLRFENRDLVGTLSRAVETTQASNENLEAEVAVRRKTEEELQKHRDLLEVKVAQRTEELSQTNQSLRDALEAKTRIEEERRSLEEQLQFASKMEALSTLAGGVAHDFNNLLMGIGGQLAIMMEARTPDDPDLERLTAMEKRVREGADLSRQLLGITLGGKYEARPTDLNLLVEKIGNFARTHKEISVQTKLADRLWTVEADMAQIEHAIMNIYLNARQAMPNGGQLSLQTRNVLINASRAQSFDVKAGEFAVVDITDTGLGMEKSLLARIFDPFFTTKEMGHGTGLGLSSAYGIVRNHGGFIEVQSEKGKGSTFSVFLPRTLALVEKEELHQAGVPPAGRKTVLLVDDESIVAEVAAIMLGKLGYRVRVALGGEAALELFKKHRHEIHLVLLDMIMPGLSGGETFRLLKEIDPSVRVLLTSGYSIEGQAQELINEGCLGFLHKPYNLASLGAKLEKALSQPVHS
jgi:signal transduction histidine kinase/ActR/RegA family two-component response regulator